MYYVFRVALGPPAWFVVQARTEDDLRQTVEKLERTLESTVRAMALAAETRDPDTAGHQRRVASLAHTIAKAMDLPEEQANIVRLAGLVHDIGKIGVPAEILSKPGRLTSIEFLLIQDHPRIGYDILSASEFPWTLAQTVLQHHERLDGSGYPAGLKGNILLEARIVGVADLVDAMASDRPYRAAVGLDAALTELTKHSGTLYDPEVVRVCCQLANQYVFALICDEHPDRNSNGEFLPALQEQSGSVKSFLTGPRQPNVPPRRASKGMTA